MPCFLPHLSITVMGLAHPGLEPLKLGPETNLSCLKIFPQLFATALESWNRPTATKCILLGGLTVGIILSWFWKPETRIKAWVELWKALPACGVSRCLQIVATPVVPSLYSHLPCGSLTFKSSIVSSKSPASGFGCHTKPRTI